MQEVPGGVLWSLGPPEPSTVARDCLPDCPTPHPPGKYLSTRCGWHGCYCPNPSPFSEPRAVRPSLGTNLGSATTLHRNSTDQKLASPCFPVLCPGCRTCRSCSCHTCSTMSSFHTPNGFPYLSPTRAEALSPRRVHLGNVCVKRLFPTEAQWVDPRFLVHHKTVRCTSTTLQLWIGSQLVYSS